MAIGLAGLLLGLGSTLGPAVRAAAPTAAAIRAQEATLGQLHARQAQALSAAATAATALSALQAQVRTTMVEVHRVERAMAAAGARLARERAREAQASQLLGSLLEIAYTHGSVGFAGIVTSPSISAALDAVVTTQQLSSAERQALVGLQSAARQAARTATRIAGERRVIDAALARLTAQQLVLQDQEATANLAARQLDQQIGTTQAAISSARAARARAAAAAAAAARRPAPPVPVPSSGPAPTFVPPPAPTAPGAFWVTTNLTQPSGVSAATLRAFLQGSPLAADAQAFIDAEHQYHVSALYLAAHAVLETGFGTSEIYLRKHNLFGFGANDANPYQDAWTFSSDTACIDFVSWYVSVNYLTPPGSEVPPYGSAAGTAPSVPTGRYYNGPTLLGMNVDYATDPLWAYKIAVIADQIQNAAG